MHKGESCWGSLQIKSPKALSVLVSSPTKLFVGALYDLEKNM